MDRLIMLASSVIPVSLMVLGGVYTFDLETLEPTYGMTAVLYLGAASVGPVVLREMRRK